MPTRRSSSPIGSGAGRGSSQLDWKKWGEVDPLFGVASWPGKGRGESAPWTDSEFYQLGAEDWDDFRALWRRYGLRPGACAEIGCGAGRITRHLAQTFERVEALDVSNGMIAYAKERISDPAVTFHVTNGLTIPLPDTSLDAVFSTHVFQHLDSHAQVATYFAEIHRVMSAGDTLMIHLPIHGWPLLPKSLDLLYAARRRAGDLRALLTHRLVETNQMAPAIRGLSFPVDWLFATLGSLGFEAIEVTVMVVGSNGSLHPFVLARRPS